MTVSALRWTEDRFRAAFNHAPVGMALLGIETDSPGQFAVVNPALCRLTGYSEDDLLTRDVDSITHPEDREATRLAFTRLLRGEIDEVQVEKRIIAADGEVRWVRASASLIRDEQRAPLYAVGHLQDISERRLDLDARAQLAAIVESSVDAIYRTDEAGRITVWNEGARSLFGYSAAEALGRGTEMLLPPGLRHERMDTIDAVRAGGMSPYATRRITQDGREIDVSVSASPVRNESGDVVGVSIMARDITAETAAAEALRHSEERFRGIVETANEGVWTVDNQGLTTFANKRMATMLGTTPDAMHGRPVADFLHGDAQAEWDGIAARRRHGISERYNCRFVRSDGEDVWALVSGCPQYGSDGQVIGSLKMVSDQTAQILAEGEHAQTVLMLDQSQRLRMMGQLAGGVAHDMNNLLSVIINFSDFALDLIDGKPGHEEVLEISEAARRASALVRQVLLFARQEVAPPEILDLSTVVEHLSKMLERTIGENITLTNDLPDDLLPIRADLGQIEQIVMNLVVNARDAMPAGGELQIRTANISIDKAWGDQSHTLLPGDYVRLSVIDDGEGMPSDVAARAFDQFFTTKGSDRGTGLGLSTCFAVVTAAGGCMGLDSELGRGTTVDVYWPVSTVRAAVAGTAVEASAAADASGETVLLVEDDENVRRITVRILEAAGYAVVAAGLPSAAIEFARDHLDRVDLLVSDVVMPEMSGPELVAQLQEGRGDLPALFISGYAARPEEVPSGAFYLSKPFTRSQLLDKVGSVLADAGGRS